MSPVSVYFVDQVSAADFSRDAESLCDQLVDRWCEYTVSKIIRDHWHDTRPPSDTIPHGNRHFRGRLIEAHHS